MKSRILIGFALNGQGRSGLSLRAARIGLLALALALAGVLLWPAPTPAEAQSQTVQLWSVSFSASDVGGNVVGCDSGSGAAATALPCPEDTVTYGGVAYKFLTIQLRPGVRLDLNVDTTGTGWPAGVANSGMTLGVNGTSLSFADVERRISGYNLRWTNPGLTWNIGDTVTLTITQEISAGPSVDSIAFNSAGADGAFKTGEAVTATVTFSEAVTVDTTDGTPQLTIDVGGSDKVLDYSSGTGTAALVFSGYTVAADDVDTDGMSIAANKLDANSGTIRATADATEDAVLTHAAVAASANHKVDGVKPTLVTTGDDAPKTSADGTTIVLTFSEDIGTADRTKITVKSGTTTKAITSTSWTLSSVRLFLTTALTTSETMVTVELSADAVADVPGNGIAAVSATTVTRILPPGKPTLTLAAKDQSIDATVVFSGHGTSDITKYQYRTKTTGSYGAWTDSTENVSNTGGTFTIEGLTNGTEYTVQARGVNSDGDGDESDAAMATPDAPPAITSVEITSTPATANTYIIGEDVVVTVTFDKAITLGTGNFAPYVEFDFGTSTQGVDCVVGTPTTTLVCTETVLEGDEDSDGIDLSEGGVYETDQFILGPLGQRANLDISGLAADTDHKVDGVKPTLSSAAASSDLTKVVLTFSEALTETPAPATGDFTLNVNTGTAPTIDSVAIDGRDVTLSLSAPQSKRPTAIRSTTPQERTRSRIFRATRPKISPGSPSPPSTPPRRRL